MEVINRRNFSTLRDEFVNFSEHLEHNICVDTSCRQQRRENNENPCSINAGNTIMLSACNFFNICGYSLQRKIRISLSNKMQNTFNKTWDYNDYEELLTDLSSEATNTSDGDNNMPWWLQLFWSTVFSIMVVVAIGGNCIVIWIVIAHRRMRTVTNYFLVNLSIADLLLSTLNCFFNFIYMLQGCWHFGRWYCTVNNFIAYATVAASVFTLTAISCDRYLAIVHPLKPRMSKVSSLIAITFIWIASMFSASPCILYSTTITYRYKSKERSACILVWPDGQPTESQMDFIYQVVFLILTYVVPISLMIACYSAMGRILWGARSIGEMNQRQVDSIKSKRKVVKMFILVVMIFAICWLPYHAYFIYTHFDRQVVYMKFIQHVYLGFYWFAMSNAMVNPLIYYWMNARFRQYFKTALNGWKCMFKKSTLDDFDTIIRRNTQSFSKSGGANPKLDVVQSGEEDPLTNKKKTRCFRHQTTVSTLLAEKSIRKASTRRKRQSLKCDQCKTTVNL